MGRNSLSHGRLRLLNVSIGGGQLLVIPCSDFMNSSLAVKPLSNCFVGLHELVKFLCQLVILVCDHSDMIVQGVNLNLKIRIVVQQG